MKLFMGCAGRVQAGYLKNRAAGELRERKIIFTTSSDVFGIIVQTSFLPVYQIRII